MVNKLIQHFDKIYIDEASLKHESAIRFQTLFPADKIEIVKERPYPEVNGPLSGREFSRSKNELFLTPYQGQFFKQCPGKKPGLVCCNYFVLNLGIQCNMNCSYCFLQSYINTPVMTIYSNIDEAITEMERTTQQHPNLPFRVGTGETIDSLSTDPLTLYSKKLMEFFIKYPQWHLELKTKTNHVAQFIDNPHCGNVIIGWSLNPQIVIDHEEHRTSSLEDRLTAAELCRSRGFPVAFHLDPLIWHPEWEKNYLQLVEIITSRFKPHEVYHISIGALRFQQEQKTLMRERFGMQSWVAGAEVFHGFDGKMRYDFSLRNRMFKTVMHAFKEKDPHWKIALCMESPDSWQETLQSTPRRIEQLDSLFRPLPQPTSSCGQFFSQPS